MSLIVRNDEQIQVGTTPGLVAGATGFTFDGTAGKPDYRGYDIVISEISGTGILVRDIEYSWDYTLGAFQLLKPLAILADKQWYNVHFQNILGSQPVNTGKIIDPSFFIRDIMIPNTGKDAITEKINLFIDKYEPECLNLILGYSLYKAILSETSTRMDELIYGAEFTDGNGQLQKWQGLVHDQNISLIANYIYYFIQSYDATSTTGVTTKLPDSEAGKSVSPADKMVFAWNFFSSEVKQMCSFLWNKNVAGVRVYPEFTVSQYKSTLNNARPTNVFSL